MFEHQEKINQKIGDNKGIQIRKFDEKIVFLFILFFFFSNIKPFRE